MSSAISMKLQGNFTEIKFPHACHPVSLLLIFRAPFLKNTSRRLLLLKIGKTKMITFHNT